MISGTSVLKTRDQPCSTFFFWCRVVSLGRILKCGANFIFVPNRRSLFPKIVFFLKPNIRDLSVPWSDPEERRKLHICFWSLDLKKFSSLQESLLSYTLTRFFFIWSFFQQSNIHSVLPQSNLFSGSFFALNPTRAKIRTNMKYQAAQRPRCRRM